MKKTIITLLFLFPVILSYSQPLQIDAKVILQGAWDANIQAMRTHLVSLDSFPLMQPYNQSPWNYQGGESIATKADSIVDWVLFELRDAEDITQIEAVRAGLLLSNGRIVDTSLSQPVSFRELDTGNYYIIIWHRNHLPVMTARPVFLPNSSILDFTDTSNIDLYGGNVNSLIQIDSGRWAMIAGDINHDMQIQYSGPGNDRSLVLQAIVNSTGSSNITSTFSAYSNEDINMDSTIKYSGPSNDPSMIIQNLVNLSGNTSITSIHRSTVPPTFHCGMPFVDKRDAKVYMTIKIGEHCWMTQNLDVGSSIHSNLQPGDNDTIEKYCYDNDTLNCMQFGGLYTWDEIMQYNNDEYTRGICPPGWHLPTDDEWYKLENFLDPMINDPLATGWRGVSGGHDLRQGGPSGFEAFLAGYMSSNGTFTGIWQKTKFWTPASSSTSKAWHRGLADINPGILRDSLDKSTALPIRCVRGNPLKFRNNIVVIDSSNTHLIYDSAMISQGTYVFEYTGTDSLDIDSGDIIVGLTHGGYLRKVTGVTYSTPNYTIQTEQANLEDVFVDADFGTSASFTDSTSTIGKYYASSRISYLAKGVSLSQGKGGLQYDFSDAVLYQNGPLTIKIDSGYFKFDPHFRFNFKYKHGAVRKLEFYTENSLIEHQIDIGVNVTAAYTLSDYDKTLATYTYDILFFVGWFPVLIEIKADLVAKSKASFDAAFDATFGYKDVKTVNIGAVYENGNWRKIFDYQSDHQPHPLTWSGEVHFRQYAALVPKLSVKLYSVAGPYMDAIAYDSLFANVVLPSINWDAMLKLGFKANIGAEVDIYGTSLYDYKQNIFAYETTLWEAPYQVSKESGDAQFGETWQDLNLPVKVKVLDNLNNSWLPVPVNFEVISGNGSVNETLVYTNSSGYAYTSWKLGAGVGLQKLKASVKRADMSQVAGSPVEFTATAYYSGPGTQPCPGLPSINYNGQAYGTVQIGNQCWLNGNMNSGSMINSAQSPSNNNLTEKYCYNDDINNCLLYGALYLWDEAMQYSGLEGARGICPPGWHIASDNDWKILEGIVDSIYGVGDLIWNNLDARGYNVGSKLKSLSAWSAGGNGTPGFGFNALPGGNLKNSVYSGSGIHSYFWTSNNSGTADAFSRKLTGTSDQSFREQNLKVNAFSVRCLRDSLCYPQPDTADAGPDSSNVPGGYFNMQGNIPTNGSGLWEIIDGSGGQLVSPSNAYSGFTGQHDSTYILTWTILTYCGSSTDTVVIHFDPYVFACGDTISDSRDNKRYATVLIGSQCWMAENLNTGTMLSSTQNQSNNGSIEKYCVNNNPGNCDIWGGLYQWNEAMQYTTTEGSRGVCPDDWHLPTDAEYRTMEGNADSYYGVGDPIWMNSYWRGYDVGDNLKSNTGWSSNGNGSNTSGFDALPAGYRLTNGTFAVTGIAAYYWSSSAYSANNSYFRGLLNIYVKSRRDNITKATGFSIRCMKD